MQNEYKLLNIVPLAEKRIQSEYNILKALATTTWHKLKTVITADWDVFEYVLRHIFVTKKQKLSKAIK